jgi:hypothetical protein
METVVVASWDEAVVRAAVLLALARGDGDDWARFAAETLDRPDLAAVRRCAHDYGILIRHEGDGGDDMLLLAEAAVLELRALSGRCE